ncbi:MAG: FAD-dependent oxidoreductase [Patescibacteria group bacterium]|nr:FAD-dependent oxidoreductase [Patescibacteria group bacterium]
MLYDLIIIGGGPAGIAAGIYASRKKINSLIISKDFGGQAVVSSKIENIIGFKEISGMEMAEVFESHLRAQDNIDIKSGILISSIKENAGGFEIETSNGEKTQSKYILIALGSGYKKLNVPGEKEFEGKGVFYCPICDAPLMKNKPVAVIGGGNSGLGAVRDLLPYASEIFLLECSDELKGDQILQDQIKKEEKVKITANAKVKEIFGDAFVKGLKYEDLNSGEEKILNLAGIFIEIGYQPNTVLVKDLVKLNEKGEIIINHQTMQTSKKGIWAAGDITDNLYNQINIAIGDGIKAVLNIYETLKKENQ